MRELNPQTTVRALHPHRARFRFVLGNAQIFAAGLGAAFLVQTGPTSRWTIATVCVGLALAGISVVTRRMGAKAPD